MKKQFVFIILFVILLNACTTGSNVFEANNLNLNGKKVGIVYVKGYEAGVAESYITTELLKKGANVIERARLRSIIGEQKLQLSGLTDTNTATKIGEIANVEMVFLSDISRPTVTNRANFNDNTWQTYSVSFSGKLVEVESGKVLMSGTATGARGFPDKALTEAIRLYFK